MEKEKPVSVVDHQDREVNAVTERALAQLARWHKSQPYGPALETEFRRVLAEFPLHGMYEKATQLLYTSAVTGSSVLSLERRASVVTVNPLRDEYQTTALLGRWREADCDIWLNTWMKGVNRRRIGEGSLFRNVHNFLCSLIKFSNSADNAFLLEAETFSSS